MKYNDSEIHFIVLYVLGRKKGGTNLCWKITETLSQRAPALQFEPSGTLKTSQRHTKPTGLHISIAKI